LRCASHHRKLRQNCRAHVQYLEHCKSILPQQESSILAELAVRPVDLLQIHNAHETVRKLRQQIDSLEQESEELEKTRRQARIDKDLAHRKLTGAIRQQQKFSEVKIEGDALITQQSNDREQDELEDRPYAAAHFSKMEETKNDFKR
jgi:hypothetical protein